MGQPDWDLEQLEVILEPASSWQLIVAGPGAGKSAVACQRLAFLIDEGVPSSRILLVSFTRTAVAELRDRIVAYAVAGDSARSVRISTIDSHAWSLRSGFEDEALPKSLGDGSYDLSIQRTVELFRDRQPELLEFMTRLEHVIIDEAQDVMGVRADVIIEMLRSLALSCGVTILADPAQAIYGFTSEGDNDRKREGSLLERLPKECPRQLLQRALKNVHRIKDTALVDLFLRTRKEIELSQDPRGHVARVQQTIRDASGNDVGVTSYESLAEFLKRKQDGSMLVLFRRRADVLFASSYCSNAGVEHRLRMSDIPTVVRPWLGWLFGDVEQSMLSREEFDKLWEEQSNIAAAPFIGEEREGSWTLLHRLAAGKRGNTLDLIHVRNILSRARPPIEVCYADLGTRGPILGTIHASKGREADNVVLVLPPHDKGSDTEGDGTDSAAVFEEGRVYYVGATRAREMLATANQSATRVGYLPSKRIYRVLGEMKAQLEIGRDGDVDRLAHLAWTNGVAVQQALAKSVGQTVGVVARAVPEADYALRLILEKKDADGVTRPIEIGELSSSFRGDLGYLWKQVDHNGKLKPGETIRHLHLVGIGTVGLSEQERNAVRRPFSASGIALVPVVKGFPLIQFLYRKRVRY